MKRFRPAILSAFALSLATLTAPPPASAQVNAEQVMVIGCNVLSMDDYMLAIQYFNAAIKAKPYLADPYFYRALAKLQLDDYRGAVEDCSLALERNKFKVEAYKLRGFARQTLGLDSLALLDYEEGLKHDPTDRYFLFYKAIAESDLRRFVEARSTYSALLRRYPDFAEAYAARGSMRALEGDTLAAFHDIDRSIELNRTNLNPWLLRAQLHAGRHEWTEALADMEEAIRLRPDDPSFYINRAYLRYNTDDFYGAMDDYNRSLDLDPDNSAALFNRALLRMEVRDLIHAEEDFTAVLRHDPENFHALYNRGIARMEQGAFREAIADFNRIAARYPKFYPVYYAIAECERERGNMKRALANVSHADELVRRYVDNPTRNRLDRPTIQPGMPNARPVGASRPGEEGEEEEDMQLMEKFNRLVTVEETPHTDMAFNDRIKGRVQDRDASARPEEAFILSFIPPDRMLRPRSDRFRELDDYNAGRHPAGMTLYLVAGPGAVSDSAGFALANGLIDSLTPAADRPDAPAADLLTRATAYSMIRNYPASLADLDRALEINPRYPLALLARGAVRTLCAETEPAAHTDAGASGLPRRSGVMMLADAVADYDAAITISPRLAYAWYGKGCALYAAGETDGALAAFSRALELDPDLGQARFNRGLCHLRAGRRTEAFADLSKAGEAGILAAYPLLKRLRD